MLALLCCAAGNKGAGAAAGRREFVIVLPQPVEGAGQPGVPGDAQGGAVPGAAHPAAGLVNQPALVISSECLVTPEGELFLGATYPS